ncbi:hypothetical protein [Streptomyces sp. NPDC058954]|uniref:hypothetical protein n=1 Tax=Streptomyces sp. NPDC058954 TaxID=3346677 RepID=UPI0036C42A02
MADEQYTWLDRATAEALLRGESLEAVDAAARDQAERLAKTLEALTAEPPPTSAELPGEAAALAAFRAARQEAPAERSAAGHRAGAHASDAGLVRIGGPVPDGRRARRGRSARFALTAVLATGMVGGVAYAVTSGVVPTPFGGEPRPATSVTAPATPSPLVSSSPHGLAGKPSPDGSTGGAGPATPGNTPGDRPSATPGAENGGWWRRQAPSACRAALRGKELTGDRRQALENAAGGYSPDRVLKYCRNVLAGTPGAAGDGKSHGGGKDDGGKGHGKDKGNGKGKSGSGKGDGHGGGRGGDDEGHIAPGGNGHGNGHRGGRKGDDSSASADPALPGHLLTTRAPTPSPQPTYTALGSPEQL